MSRSNDALLKLKAEVTDPIYTTLSPAEIAIKLNTAVSKPIPEFIEVPQTVTAAYLFNLLGKKGLVDVVADAPPPIQQEVLTKRADELSLGEVTQGDVEQALKI